MFSVVLMSALQNANPSFLEKIFGGCPVPRQRQQITQQPMLVLLDEAVEQVGIATAEALRDLGLLIHYQVDEITGRCVHTTGNTQEGQEKTQGEVKGNKNEFVGRNWTIGINIEALCRDSAGPKVGPGAKVTVAD